MTQVDYSSRGLSKLPEDIESLQIYDVLNLGFNYLETLPAEIGQLKQLQKLILTRNFLKELPDEIGQLENLEELRVDSNSLTSLPDAIGDLKQLSFLDIHWNQVLPQLPDSFTKLSNLKSLDISGCSSLDLEVTFELLSELPALERLYLNNLKLEDNLLEGFDKLKSLKTIWLNNNKLSSLPATVLKITDLESLALIKNPNLNWAEVFDDLEQLPNLEFLILNDNGIAHLPNNIAKLSNLKKLVLPFNNLTELPNSMATLQHFEQLDITGVDHFNLESLAKKTPHLKELNMQMLSVNPSSFPTDFTQLKKLTLSDSYYSEEEKEKFKARLPETEIVFR